MRNLFIGLAIIKHTQVKYVYYSPLIKKGQLKTTIILNSCTIIL